MTCPCGKGESLEACCGPVLAGEAWPDRAEDLMRARYTAYATGNVDFILESHEPSTRNEVDRKNTEMWSRQSEWLGLEVTATEQGGPDDQVGFVEFQAKYKIKGTTIQHRERAEFRRVAEKWYFVDGQELKPEPVRRGPQVGRNDPCPCGSGKKHKKCCGAN